MNDLTAMMLTPTGIERDGEQVTRWSAIREWVLERDSHTCQGCGAPAKTVDHIWPQCLGGDDHVDNLRALCARCNSSKGGRVRLNETSHRELVNATELLVTKIEAFERVLAAVVGERMKRCFNGSDPEEASDLLELAEARKSRFAADSTLLIGMIGSLCQPARRKAA